MFANYRSDTIVCYTESTKGWETLQCYDKKYTAYTSFVTCHIDRSKLFQLGVDRTCQMLIPDQDRLVLKFTVEPRKPHPYKASWSIATLIYIPEDSCVMVCGIKWDSGLLNPWCYNIRDNTWSYKHGKGDSPQNPIPALPCVRGNGSGCLLAQAVYLFCGMDE